MKVKFAFFLIYKSLLSSNTNAYEPKLFGRRMDESASTSKMEFEASFVNPFIDELKNTPDYSGAYATMYDFLTANLIFEIYGYIPCDESRCYAYPTAGANIMGLATDDVIPYNGCSSESFGINSEYTSIICDFHEKFLEAVNEDGGYESSPLDFQIRALKGDSLMNDNAAILALCFDTFISSGISDILYGDCPIYDFLAGEYYNLQEYVTQFVPQGISNPLFSIRTLGWMFSEHFTTVGNGYIQIPTELKKILIGDGYLQMMEETFGTVYGTSLSIKAEMLHWMFTLLSEDEINELGFNNEDTYAELSYAKVGHLLVNHPELFTQEEWCAFDHEFFYSRNGYLEDNGCGFLYGVLKAFEGVSSMELKELIVDEFISNDQPGKRCIAINNALKSNTEAIEFAKNLKAPC